MKFIVLDAGRWGDTDITIKTIDENLFINLVGLLSSPMNVNEDIHELIEEEAETGSFSFDLLVFLTNEYQYSKAADLDRFCKRVLRNLDAKGYYGVMTESGSLTLCNEDSLEAAKCGVAKMELEATAGCDW